MSNKLIQGKTAGEWEAQYPLVKDIVSGKEVFWINPQYENFDIAEKKVPLTDRDVKDAEERLRRFAPYIRKAFPETEKSDGIIESPVASLENMKRKIEASFNIKIPCKLLLKCDNELPISGSIKARGGIYEILKYAEKLALENNMLSIEDDYSVLDSEKFRAFFSKYSVAVGSTGNLGLSIGIISARLGFKVYVHMSADARQWKKDLLRSKGVTVIEYNTDYSIAVTQGRKQAESDPLMYFVDDENSQDLFLGYAVAAYRLKDQLEKMNISVDKDHPLFVFIPCGVGGGPGGVTFGLKLVFKDNVHCFFAEPTHSPCMLLGLMTGMHNKISVQDFGLDNLTEADGLAVGRASGFVGKTMENLISGSYTVYDDKLFILLSMLADSENIKLEPSAVAGLPGAIRLFSAEEGKGYLQKNKLAEKIKEGTIIVWATGGNMVPPDVMDNYYKKGKQLYAK